MKLFKIIISMGLPLFLSGCLEEFKSFYPQNVSLDSNDDAYLGEKHILTIDTGKEDLIAVIDNYKKTCSELQCYVLSSTAVDKSSAQLKILIPNINVDELLEKVKAKVVSKALLESINPSDAGLEKRLAIKNATFDSLLSKLNQDTANPLKVSEELNNIQTDIETIKLFQKIKDKPIKLKPILKGNLKDKKTEVKTANDNKKLKVISEGKEYYVDTNPKLIMLDIKLGEVVPFYGLNINLIKDTFAKSYKIFVISASYAIVSLAIILPWLPLAVIFMWLLSIVFKQKIKIKTFVSQNKTKEKSRNAGDDKEPFFDSADDDDDEDVPEKKKGLLGGLFTKKVEPAKDTSTEETEE
ncbi:MAG: hypothetical protein AB7U85_02185 [Alphaproteobacteria bacterium]